MTKKQDIKVKETETATIDIIGDEIVAISQGIKKLRSGKLNDRALVLLIANACPNVGRGYSSIKVGATHVRAVLEGIENLERCYLKKPKAD